MSYDLFAFERDAAPETKAEFDAWYVDETESEDSGSDPAILSGPLRRWFDEMTQVFPSLNGPAAPPDIEDRDDAGDYNIRPKSIYVSFGWSHASRAGVLGLEAAQRCGVGLYDPQGDNVHNYPQIDEKRQRRGLLGRLFGG